MDLLGFAASINREKVAKEAVFAKNSSDLKRKQVRRALCAAEKPGFPAYDLVSERMVEKIFRTARKDQRKCLLSEYDSSSGTIRTDIPNLVKQAAHRKRRQTSRKRIPG